MKNLVVVSLLLVGCRTEIQPVVKGESAARRMRQRDAKCEVHDFAGATDVPSGAKPLGLVKIERQSSDELTFEMLRKKVCELGGDGISQIHWIRASGASVADAPIELEGNAWSLP